MRQKTLPDGLSEDHDYILVFAKNKQAWEPNALPVTEDMIARYKNADNDPRGVWQSDNLTARNPYEAGTYSVTCPSGRVIEGPPRGTYWRVSKQKFKELDADNRIWWGENGNNMPRLKRFLSEVKQGRTPQTFWSWKEVGHTQDAKKTLLRYVPFQHTENVLNSVKPVELIQRMLQLATSPDDDAIVLDFFGGSAVTAHAVLKQNQEDGGKRRFISVQIAEPLPIPEQGMTSIFEMGRVRITNVINELRKEAKIADPLGFRILKIDSSNMKDVYYTPDVVTQEDLLGQVDNIKEDRADEDILFQVLLDWGVDLSLPIKAETIAGKQVYFVDENALAACFETDVEEDFVKALAERKPLRAVFRDGGYGNDSTKINVEQIFKLISPTTEVKTI